MPVEQQLTAAYDSVKKAVAAPSMLPTIVTPLFEALPESLIR